MVRIRLSTYGCIRPGTILTLHISFLSSPPPSPLLPHNTPPPPPLHTTPQAAFLLYSFLDKNGSGHISYEELRSIHPFATKPKRRSTTPLDIYGAPLNRSTFNESRDDSAFVRDMKRTNDDASRVLAGPFRDVATPSTNKTPVPHYMQKTDNWNHDHDADAQGRRARHDSAWRREHPQGSAVKDDGGGGGAPDFSPASPININMTGMTTEATRIGGMGGMGGNGHDHGDGVSASGMTPMTATMNSMSGMGAPLPLDPDLHAAHAKLGAASRVWRGAELKRLFEQYDRDRSGFVSRRAFVRAVKMIHPLNRRELQVRREKAGEGGRERGREK